MAKIKIFLKKYIYNYLIININLFIPFIKEIKIYMWF